MRYNLVFLILQLSLFISSHVYSQGIKGVVKDPNLHPLAGITVLEKNNKNGVTTDRLGVFFLSSAHAGSILIISGLGFETQELVVDTGMVIQIILIPKANALDEVQVIGYGTGTQRYNVGAVTKVKAADIEKQAISNPLAALQGRVPGLVVTATSGMPGSSFNVQVRGQNTLNPDLMQSAAPIDNPLYIIDGVPFAPQNANVNQFPSVIAPGIGTKYGNPYGGASPFNNISPSDIESIEVLRDADATAIYGSRGGNGVILITTKKGSAGKTSFRITSSTGFSRAGKTMPMMNTPQYLSMRREAFANDSITPNSILYDPGYAPDLLIFDTSRYTDWKSVFLGGTAHTSNINFSVSGGSSNTQFHLGGSWARSTYIYPGNFFDNKAGMLFNLHHNVAGGRFQIDFSSNLSFDNNKSSAAQDLITVFTLEPNYPEPLDAMGNLIWNYENVGLNGSYAGRNPYAYLKQKYSIENRLVSSSLQLSYKLLEGLMLKSSLGYSNLDGQEYSGNPRSAQNPEWSPVATARFGTNDYTTWIIEPQLAYKKNWTRLLFDLVIGGTYQKNTNKRTQADGSGYINDELIESISGAPTRTAWDSQSEYRYAALFGRLGLRWDKKYLINFSGRRDGSSRFGPGKQFGNFGAVGAGWLFAEEKFIKNLLPFLSYGKIRVSYGVTGSDAVGDYNYIARWMAANYDYNGELGYLPQNLFNPDFSWAATKKLEAGIELGLFKDRLLFNAGWYQNRSSNQLISYQLPATTGFPNVTTNWNAVVQNRGLELSLQSTVIKAMDFSWITALNLTIPKNKLRSFPGIEQSSYATVYIVGQPLTVLNKFRYAMVNPETGLFQFYDTNGNITDNPQLPAGGNFNDYNNIGNLDPKFYGGWSNNFSYKGLQVDCFLEFRKQLGQNFLSQVYTFYPGYEFNQPVELLNRWQSSGDLAPYQRFYSGYGEAFKAAQNFAQSSGVYSDASYIRFRTVSLGYTVPSTLLRRTKLQGMKLFATGQNLFTITSYKGNDPETQSFYGVPVVKTVVFGLQLQF